MGKNFDKVEISYELITNKRYIYKLCLEKRKEYIGFFENKKIINKLPERLWKHIHKEGAKYTKKYKPKIQENILQCTIHEANTNAFAHEMFYTLERMNYRGINKVRGGPFIWVRDYNTKEKIVINFFIDEMKKGWNSFVDCYETFKLFNYDDFYVYSSSILPSKLKYQQQINLFNFITNHIKECKFQQKCRARDKNTVYIRLEPALNEIKRLHRENQNLRKRKLDDDSDDDTPSSKKRKI
jgi:predicted GIY-YIG superfamily endonuclease